MLVLSRKTSEAIIAGTADGIQQLVKITVLEIGRGFVKLGIEAPASVAVHRHEVWARINHGGVPVKAA